jgi:uncharacterized membrane protein (DUF4010 family)
MEGFPDLRHGLESLAESILIGFLIGVQREGFRGSEEPQSATEIRDFVLAAVMGCLCGIIGNPLLAVAGFLGVAGILCVHFFDRRKTPRLTSDFTALAVFLLGYLVGLPQFEASLPIAIAASIALASFLALKKQLQEFVREDLTQEEFLGTLRFLALIFVIYPALPEGRFGPYESFEPRKIWIFMILISSISYVGYFLEKFLGGAKSMTLTGLLGGVASTTAATGAFARRVREEPEKQDLFWYAAVVANTVQLPRLLAVLWLVRPLLVQALILPAAVMTLVSGALAWFLTRRAFRHELEERRVRLGNPLALMPVLKFGLIFTAILFVTRAAGASAGRGGVFATSFVGGLVDVDAVALSVGDMRNAGSLEQGAALISVFLALTANAMFKTFLSWSQGNRSFGKAIGGSFLLIYSAGLIALLAQ